MSETFGAFVSKWANPAIIIFMFTITWGAIQWGNKLTDESIQAAKERGAISAELSFFGSKIYQDDSRNIEAHAKQGQILKAIADQLSAMEKRADRLEQRMGRNESLIIENQRDAHEHGNGQ